MQQCKVRVAVGRDRHHAQRVAVAEVGPGAVAQCEQPPSHPLRRSAAGPREALLIKRRVIRARDRRRAAQRYGAVHLCLPGRPADCPRAGLIPRRRGGRPLHL